MLRPFEKQGRSQSQGPTRDKVQQVSIGPFMETEGSDLVHACGTLMRKPKNVKNKEMILEMQLYLIRSKSFHSRVERVLFSIQNRQ